MSKSRNSLGSSPNGLLTVNEVYYRREVLYQCGGGDFSIPKRTKSDLNINNSRSCPCPQPSIMNANSPCAQTSTMLSNPSKSLCCTSGNISLIKSRCGDQTMLRVPPNTPYSSPMNCTSNSSLMVPKMANRSRSTGSIDNRHETSMGLSSTRIGNKSGMTNITIGNGEVSILSGNRSVSKIFKN